jgi:hypothetical protein
MKRAAVNVVLFVGVIALAGMVGSCLAALLEEFA